MGLQDETLVTVETLQDPVQARMHRDLLEQEGIEVLLPGVEHRGMLGMVGAYVAIPVRVPESQAERAREILAALTAESATLVDESDVGGTGATAEDGGRDASGVDGAETEAFGGPGKQATGREKPASPRLKRVATFIAFVMPFGAAHMYLNDYRNGFLLAFSQAFALGVTMGGARYAGFAMLAVVAVDLVASLARIGAGRRAGSAGASSKRPRWALVLPLTVPLVVLGSAAPFAYRRLEPVAATEAARSNVCQAAAACKGVEADDCERALAEAVAVEPSVADAVVDVASCLPDAPSCSDSRGCLGRAPALWPVLRRE
jgi:hypothetical protein